MKLSFIKCEACWDVKRYCRHCTVGRTCSNNDVNVLTRLRLFKDIILRLFHFRSQYLCKIVPDGEQRGPSYLLARSIYPDWHRFFKLRKVPDVLKEPSSELQPGENAHSRSKKYHVTTIPNVAINPAKNRQSAGYICWVGVLCVQMVRQVA